MPTITASSMKEAKELMNCGKYKEIVLNFDIDIDADDFFTLATSQSATKVTITDRNNRSSVNAEK